MKSDVVQIPFKNNDIKECAKTPFFIVLILSQKLYTFFSNRRRLFNSTHGFDTIKDSTTTFPVLFYIL